LQNSYQEKLSHLTQEQIEELMKRYYNNEKNDLLIEEYNIDIRNSLLSKTFPLKEHKNIVCPFCDIPMLSYRESKSTSSWHKEEIFCQECSHKHNISFCNCLNCKKNKEILQEIQRQEKKLLDNEKIEILLSTFIYESEDSIDLDTLTIKDKLYISALLRTSLSEDLEYINPISSTNLKLAPTKKYKMNLISYLRENNFILFSPNTALDSVIIEDEEIISYYPMDVTFKLNIDLDNYEEHIQNLLHLDIIEDIDSELKIQLWSEIALSECLEFLYAKMEEYNLPIDYIGDKTISALKESLKHFSTSQNFNFIWRTVKNAAAFYQKDKISKKHAVNTIAGGILRSCEKAKAENWEVKGYGRDYNYPQSLISEIFFDTILEIGDKGFTSVIG